ncbi:MAG: hypothetical protein ACQEXC_15095 [Pseudomonadota bacterium]
MKKSKSYARLGLLLLITHTSSVYSESMSWVPLLETWEDGCAETREWKRFRRNVGVYNSSTNLPEIGSVMLPEKYRDALGDIVLAGRESYYSLFTVDVKHGEYYGVPVNGFGFYVGHSNGFNVSYVELGVGLEEAKERLSGVDYQKLNHESGVYQAKLMELPRSGNAMLVCDKSL